MTDVGARRHIHGDIMARRQQTVVGVGTRNDGAKHDGLIGLVLEVAVPELVELRSHLLELLLSWPQLVTRIDGVG